ncbi:MAG: hypothetical protein SangKO_086740 [Sandaracinaceae bacterium]
MARMRSLVALALGIGLTAATASAGAQDIPMPRVERHAGGVSITLMPGVTPAIRVPTTLPGAAAPVAPAPVAPIEPAAPAQPTQPIQPAPEATRPTGAPRLFGVFVGITDYPSASDLPFCADDARRMQRAFLNAGLMQVEHTAVLTDRAATRGQVTAAIDRFSRMAGAGDTVVFFFSGHGNQVPDQDGDELDGTDETLLFADGAMTDDELTALLARGVGRDFVALDSCYSGGFQRDLARLPDSVGFYASAEDQVSYVADEFSAGGYLSYHLAQNITRMAGRPIPMWELQRDLAADFERSGASQRQHLTVGLSRGVNTRTVLLDAPPAAIARYAVL